MNFAVADSYMMHQGVGLSTSPDTDLRNFTDLSGIPIIDATAYASLGTVSVSTAREQEALYLMSTFAAQQTTNATVRTNRIAGTNIIDERLRKVGNREIYVVEGDITLRSVIGGTTPWTLIVRNGNLTIEGAVDAHAMFIVPDGYIDFVTLSCNSRDVVKGIYMAGQ